jgi:hypothetical protein
MARAYQHRSTSFRWEARAALYDHFSATHGLDKHRIDVEIADASKVFKLRKGQAIEPRELWQKVGLQLEQKIQTGTL